MNPYETLGLKPDATPAEIKVGWQRVAKKLHPDKQGGDKEAFQAAQDAYSILSDPNRKLSYDQTGTTAPPNQMEQAVLAQLALLLEAVVSGEDDLETTPLIEFLHQKITQIEKAIAEAQVVNAKSIKRRETAIKRFKRRSGGDNIVVSLMQSALMPHLAMRERMLFDIALHKELRVVLKDYLYEINQPNIGAMTLEQAINQMHKGASTWQRY